MSDDEDETGWAKSLLDELVDPPKEFLDSETGHSLMKKRFKGSPEVPTGVFPRVRGKISLEIPEEKGCDIQPFLERCWLWKEEGQLSRVDILQLSADRRELVQALEEKECKESVSHEVRAVTRELMRILKSGTVDDLRGFDEIHCTESRNVDANQCGNPRCSNPPLPGTRFCQHHILEDESQCLFEHCSNCGAARLHFESCFLCGKK